jgi:hypothetical protein
MENGHGRSQATATLSQTHAAVMAEAGEKPQPDGEHTMNGAANGTAADTIAPSVQAKIAALFDVDSAGAHAADAHSNSNGFAAATTFSERDGPAPQQQASQGVRVRFLPLNVLYIYSGKAPGSGAPATGGAPSTPASSRQGRGSLGGSSSTPGRSVAAPHHSQSQSQRRARSVLVHDQTGPRSIVAAAGVTSSVRRVGFQLASLQASAYIY